VLAEDESINAGMQFTITTTVVNAPGAARDQPIRRPGTGAHRGLQRHGRSPGRRGHRRQSSAPPRGLLHLGSTSGARHLGPALSARHDLLPLRPLGNGKTSIADASARVMGRPFHPRALLCTASHSLLRPHLPHPDRPPAASPRHPWQLREARCQGGRRADPQHAGVGLGQPPRLLRSLTPAQGNGGCSSSTTSAASRRCRPATFSPADRPSGERGRLRQHRPAGTSVACPSPAC